MATGKPESEAKWIFCLFSGRKLKNKFACREKVKNQNHCRSLIFQHIAACLSFSVFSRIGNIKWAIKSPNYWTQIEINFGPTLIWSKAEPAIASFKFCKLIVIPKRLLSLTLWPPCPPILLVFFRQGYFRTHRAGIFELYGTQIVLVYLRLLKYTVPLYCRYFASWAIFDTLCIL